MDAQNSRIEELLQKIKQQQYKLDKQNLQIKSLQSKVSPCTAPGSTMGSCPLQPTGTKHQWQKEQRCCSAQAPSALQRTWPRSLCRSVGAEVVKTKRPNQRDLGAPRELALGNVKQGPNLSVLAHLVHLQNKLINVGVINHSLPQIPPVP